MSLIIRMLKQTAVYWAPSNPDDFGRYTFVDPVQIKCRWEDKFEEIFDKHGRETIARHHVYVGVDVALGGFLLKGLLVSVPGGSTPQQVGAKEIIKFESLPNAKAKEFLREAWL